MSTLAAANTTLKVKIASTFTLIGSITELDGVDPELKMRMVTALDSAYVVKRPAITDLGKLSGKLWYDPNNTVHIACRAKVYTPPTAPDEFKMTFNDGLTTPASDDFFGYFTKFKPTGIEREGTLEADFEIELTDGYTFTAGTP